MTPRWLQEAAKRRPRFTIDRSQPRRRKIRKRTIFALAMVAAAVIVLI